MIGLVEKEQKVKKVAGLIAILARLSAQNLVKNARNVALVGAPEMKRGQSTLHAVQRRQRAVNAANGARNPKQEKKGNER